MSALLTVRIAQISDPHFGTEVDAVRDALLADLHADPPDLLLLTGDITQRARSAQFAAARDFLGALPPMPRICLPGNHDLPLFDVFTRFTRPYGRFRRFISPQREPVFEDARLAVLGVDATSPWRHKDGKVNAAQIDGLASRIARLPQPFRLVATHQPLASATHSDTRNVIHGAPQALQRWIGAGADLFLGGHIHLPYCLPVETPDGQRRAMLLQAGTCISHRTRQGVPNSYNVIVLEQDLAQRRMHMERRDFDATTGAFMPRHRHVAVNALRTGAADGDASTADSWNLVAEGSA
ncbi:MAG: metallophosphoesterase [Pseudomonadota bacterium]|nr:metallophosphoesterase [Pseudomonadota bacterium]